MPQQFDVIVIQLALLTASHAQPAPVVMDMLAVPPLALKTADLGEIE
jgi:hypothetical protein